MKTKKRNADDLLKVVEVEFKVSMHCNACERTVAKTISEFKGVQKFTTDMNQHKVVVTGRIDPQKVLKKLKKKTGKRVEIVGKKKEEEEEGRPVKDVPNISTSRGGGNVGTGVSEPVAVWQCWEGYCTESDALMMFSDENPNACSIS